MIKGFFDTHDLIKVITGVRRSGKSELLKLIELEALKVTDREHIIYINFEDIDSIHLRESKPLHDFITSHIKDEKKYFLLFDEIQEVKEWEIAVNSLRLRNTDIYITGSNSKLLSGELATHIAGRYVAFEIYPLSYKEFVQFRNECGLQNDSLHDYVSLGGFPAISTNNYAVEQARKLVQDIHASAVLKDVVTRNKIKNVALLEKIIDYVYDNIGNLLSIRNIEAYLKNNGGGSFETISNYISFLENACIISKAQRYEIKGKRLLESNDKYYLADHSLQYVMRDMKKTNISGILENVVYNELIRRGYKVYIGKMSNTDNREIDFVAEKNNGDEKLYVQVCYEYGTKETMDREFTPLTEIKDHYPKYVVTLDNLWNENRNGVAGIHLKDFLLKESFSI
jgi:predicted AAA+ superfamily ATPase